MGWAGAGAKVAGGSSDPQKEKRRKKKNEFKKKTKLLTDTRMTASLSMISKCSLYCTSDMSKDTLIHSIYITEGKKGRQEGKEKHHNALMVGVYTMAIEVESGEA